MEREFSEKVIANSSPVVEPSGQVWAGEVVYVISDISVGLQSARNNSPTKHPKKKKGAKEKQKKKRKRKKKKEK